MINELERVSSIEVNEVDESGPGYDPEAYCHIYTGDGSYVQTYAGEPLEIALECKSKVELDGTMQRKSSKRRVIVVTPSSQWAHPILPTKQRMPLLKPASSCWMLQRSPPRWYECNKENSTLNKFTSSSHNRGTSRELMSITSGSEQPKQQAFRVRLE